MGQVNHERELIILRLYWLATKDDRIFKRVWDLVKGMAKTGKYFDPTNARERQDWEGIGFSSCWDAFQSYDPSRGEMKLTSWIRTKINQALARELNLSSSQSRLHTINFNGCKRKSDNDDSFILEEFFYSEIKEYSSETFPNNFDSDREKLYIRRIESQLKRNPRMLWAFKLKLSNPSLNQTNIAKQLGVTGQQITNYFKVIRKTVKEVLLDG